MNMRDSLRCGLTGRLDYIQAIRPKGTTQRPSYTKHSSTNSSTHLRINVPQVDDMLSRNDQCVAKGGRL